MIPKTKKLFISYRSSDAAKVDKIARDLGLLQYDDGTARYKTWQDKSNLPPASPHWWDAIVDAIDDCDVFVFHISRESLQSAVCLAELDYAHNRNRPIIPIVLEGEFFLDPASGKYNIAYWELIPEWLAEQQFLFYTGTDFFARFQQAIEMFERNWPRDVYSPRPLNPDSKSVHGSNHALYDAACDYAERMAFEEAKKHFSALVRRNDRDYADVAAEWLELLGLYAELIEIDERRSARFIFNTKWKAYQSLFPKIFLDGIFDPKNFARYDKETSPPVEYTPKPEPVKIQKIKTPPPPVQTNSDWLAGAVQVEGGIASFHRLTTSLSLMPAPFAWIEIPNKGYSIAKYPVTNAQYAKFIEAGGYKQKKWWTDAGWQKREESKWTGPSYWIESKWNGTEQPVVGVSWYESIAFCLWLSDVTGEKIMLPTEDQWQYAAQGDDGRAYPWGNDWDCKRCNNSVSPCSSKLSTSVTQYEGIGDSPFGVTDMVGNVWEWCLTDYSNKTNDINSGAKYRLLCGGDKSVSSSFKLRCNSRHWNTPGNKFNFWGFRLALL